MGSWDPGGINVPPSWNQPAPAPYSPPAPTPAPEPPPPSQPPPMPQAAPPIPPAQFAALLYGKAIPVGLASRATWGGRIIEGPVFTVIDNEMTASWISAFFLPMNYWSATRTVTELLFDGKLAWSLAGGSLLPSGLNVGGATASTEQRIRFNTGLLSQMPDAWSVARFGTDAVAYIPLVTATLQNIRLKQFGADNPIPFVSLTVDDTQFAAPGDLVPWQDALETLARYDGRSSAEFATVDVTDGIEVPFILGNDLTLPTLLAGLRKIKPQWSVLTKDKLYVVEKGASSLDLTLERAKVLKRGDDPITLHEADALARPREEDYTFIDLDRDFEPSMVRCVEDLEPVISTGSVDIQTIDLPFATRSNVVQAMANYAYYSREVARESSEWSGRGDYLGIEPGDTYLISPDEMPVAAQHYHRVNEIVRKVDLTVDVKGEAFLNCGVPVAPSIFNWNELDKNFVNLSNHNLTATTISGVDQGVRGVTGFSSGKFYWEATMTIWNGWENGVGLSTLSASYGTCKPGQAMQTRLHGGVWGMVVINGVDTGVSTGFFGSGTIIGIAVDLSAGLIWFRVAPVGDWNGSGTANPATGAGGLSLGGLSGQVLYPVYGAAGTIGDAVTANFGQSAFAGAVPAGFHPGWFV